MTHRINHLKQHLRAGRWQFDNSIMEILLSLLQAQLVSQIQEFGGSLWLHQDAQWLIEEVHQVVQLILFRGIGQLPQNIRLGPLLMLLG